MELSLTQRYALCALNDEGYIPANELDAKGAFVAAALFELVSDGIVKIDGDRIRRVDGLPQRLSHLAPVYDYVERHGGTTFMKLAEALLAGDEHTAFIAALCQPMVSEGAMTSGQDGVYVPVAAVRRAQIDALAASLEGDGQLARSDAALISFMLGGGIVDQLFHRDTRRHIHDILRKGKTYEGHAENETLMSVFKNIQKVYAPLVRDFVASH